jgi:hypothetical protein
MGKKNIKYVKYRNNQMSCIRSDTPSKEIKKLQKKTGLPICDGTSYPFIKHCSNNASNWSPPDKNGNPKQCIITNPATPNLNHGSIYTCGFLW